MRKRIIQLAILLIALWVTIFAKQAPDSEFKLKNKTSALQVVSTELIPMAVVIPGEAPFVAKITFLNSGSKDIADYYVSSSPKTGVGTDWGFSGQVLAPGQAITFLASPLEGQPLVVEAVLFDDGTGEGNLKILREIRDRRRGIKRQLERGRDLIRQETEQPSAAGSTKRLKNLKHLLEDLPEEKPGRDVPPEMSVGIAQAKKILLARLAKIEPEQGGGDINENATRLAQELDHHISKIRD